MNNRLCTFLDTRSGGRTDFSLLVEDLIRWAREVSWAWWVALVKRCAVVGVWNISFPDAVILARVAEIVASWRVGLALPVPVVVVRSLGGAIHLDQDVILSVEVEGATFCWMRGCVSRVAIVRIARIAGVKAKFICPSGVELARSGAQ